MHVDPINRLGSVAERSKALVLGTSLFGGVGSNPTAATCFICNNNSGDKHTSLAQARHRSPKVVLKLHPVS